MTKYGTILQSHFKRPITVDKTPIVSQDLSKFGSPITSMKKTDDKSPDFSKLLKPSRSVSDLKVHFPSLSIKTQ